MTEYLSVKELGKLLNLSTATICISYLDRSTRELVESLLKAQEEK